MAKRRSISASGWLKQSGNRSAAAAYQQQHGKKKKKKKAAAHTKAHRLTSIINGGSIA